MKALKILVGIIAALAIGFIIFALLTPKHYKVERSIVVNAPVSAVYNEMRYFKNFNNWSPWHDLDPAMTVTIEGTDGEVGAKYIWASTKEEVGNGSLMRVEQKENQLLVSELRIADWNVISHAGYNFEQADGGTKVTWYTEGDLPFVTRPMGLMMDGMMGKDFEKGLQRLKTYMEGLPS